MRFVVDIDIRQIEFEKKKLIIIAVVEKKPKKTTRRIFVYNIK